MEKFDMIENIDLIMDKPETLLDKAKFIISHVYYYIRTYYEGKLIDTLSSNFQEYLDTFKNKFDKININNNFSFDFLNKPYIDKHLENVFEKNNDIPVDIYYDLLYKSLINIIIEQNKYKYPNDLIDSFISLRNCFIFIEYLYLFLVHYPDKLSHYIIKTDISILLNIPKKSSKRIINSDEFFYLSLVELKKFFPEINYVPSIFITQIENSLYQKYYIDVIQLKKQKLIKLEKELLNLLKTLSKIYDINHNNKVALLYSFIHEKYKNLSKDLDNPIIKINFDELIQKYILEPQKYVNKFLEDILKEINDEKNFIPYFNYLFLISLNHFNQLNQKKFIDEKIVISNIDNYDESKVIEKEEINMKNKYFEDKDISELKYEEIIEEKNKYLNFIKRHFLYNKVLTLDKSNIYNILFFLEINKLSKEKRVKNLDNLYIEYKNNFISSVKDLNCIDYNYFHDLISTDNFHAEIFSILKSYLNYFEYHDEIKEQDKNQNKSVIKFINSK